MLDSFFNFHSKDFKNGLEISVSLGTTIQLMSGLRGWISKIFGIWINIFNHPIKFWKKNQQRVGRLVGLSFACVLFSSLHSIQQSLSEKASFNRLQCMQCAASASAFSLFWPFCPSLQLRLRSREKGFIFRSLGNAARGIMQLDHAPADRPMADHLPTHRLQHSCYCAPLSLA